MSTIEKAAAKLVSKKKTVQPSESVADKSDIQTSAIAVQVSEIDNKTVENAAPTTVLHQTCELDFEMLAENGFLVPGHNNPQQSQEFRRIKRPLLLNQQPKIAAELPLPTNVIFITSAMPGEGKTFVSLNLALSLAAELDKRVLLIDGDAAKQDLSRWMGIAEQPGLVDLLTSGKPYAESSIIDTNVERLQVMPCGSMVDNLDELYASRLMDTLLSGLASFDTNRILIVDGPPLIATTEAAVLARRMGQVVLVVEANKTPQSAVEQAAAQLEGCQLVSTLLNKATGSSSAGYGYGYGYGYGQHAKNSE
ncbi:MAG: P-loop NTPase [Pseudomonadales bacterium]|jgi:exopolysaccharide/PEP-CTERM locus tyrosine autokinase|nr:P-loop NTPase [Pseudomonadales bacterium]